MQQHAARFIAHTEGSTGSELPWFIKDEFDAFLKRGILALSCGLSPAFNAHLRFAEGG